MVKIGLIGLGKWGKNHLKSLSELDCNLVGVSDVTESKKEIAEKYGLDFFQDYKKLLPFIDAVVITAPTDLHYETVAYCLNAGKHVLVEKPISLTSEESKKLTDLAKSKNLILSVGYLFRFNNSILCVKKLIKEIGEVQYITCRYIHSTKPPRKDSGAILNLAIHPIDILNFITDKKPVKVYSKKKNLLSKNLEDSAVIIFDYKDFFATIEVSCTHPEKKRDMWIIAEKEKLYVDYFNQKIIRYPIIVSYENVERKDPLEEEIVANEPLKDELNYFIKFVEKKNQKEVDNSENIGQENYYTTLMCELAIKSAETGKEMMIK
jgi:predicted dehydrogenase